MISAEDWEQQQETLAILQNNNLMEQIAKSMTTYSTNQGYTPTIAEINKILSL